MSLKQEPLIKTSIFHLIRHSRPTEGRVAIPTQHTITTITHLLLLIRPSQPTNERVATPTQHNIDYETKVSHVERTAYLGGHQN